MGSLYDKFDWKKPERPAGRPQWGSDATKHFNETAAALDKKKSIARKMVDKFRVNRAEARMHKALKKD